MTRVNVNTVRIPTIAWESIPIKVPASMVITDKEDDKNIIYTAQLKFLTCSELNRGKYAWLVTLSDGSAYLLGSDDRPFAEMTVNQSMPENIKDNQLIDVTITYSSAYNISYVTL